MSVSTWIVTENISFLWPGSDPVFSGLSLAVTTSRIGLVGANGAGKSSLLKILAGELAPSTGVVARRGRVAMLPQSEEFLGSATVSDVLEITPILLALERLAAGEVSEKLYQVIGDVWNPEARALQALREVGLDALALDRPFASLSGGERTRVRLARLIMLSPDVLLLDEPTNHLDEEARSSLANFVRSWTRGIIVASHDRDLLCAVDQIWELKRGQLHVHTGNFESWTQQRAIMDAAAAARIQSARQNLEVEKVAAQAVRERQEKRQSAAAKSAPHQGLPKIAIGIRKRRAQNTSAKLGETHARRVAAAASQYAEAKANRPHVTAAKLDLPEGVVPHDLAPTRVTACVRGFNVSIHGRKLWNHDLNVEVHGPARVAVVGTNGSGKTTLLKALAARLTPSCAMDISGEARLTSRQFVYLDQHLSGWDLNVPASVHARSAAADLDESERRTRLGRMLVGHEMAERPLAGLSGGERLRAILALELLKNRHASALLLDEPSNHLDLDSLRCVATALSQWQGALFVVSHDRRFLHSLGISAWWELSPHGLKVL